MLRSVSVLAFTGRPVHYARINIDYVLPIRGSEGIFEFGVCPISQVIVSSVQLLLDPIDALDPADGGVLLQTLPKARRQIKSVVATRSLHEYVCVEDKDRTIHIRS